MFRVLILFGLLLFVHANVQPSALSLSTANNLKAMNYTGASITPGMVTYFVKIINEAYLFFKEDLQTGTSYIQNKLEGSYKGHVDVIIFKENVTTGMTIYSDNDSIVVWTFVNQDRPTWTYIINIQTYTGLETSYVSYYFNGKGISSTKKQVIMNIADKVDAPYSSCVCQDLYLINNYLHEFDGQFWSVVCKGPGADYIFGRVNSLNQQYIETYGKCLYLIWAIQ